MKLKQYRPAFIDTDEPLQIIEFNTYEELINIEHVKRFMKDSKGYEFNKLSVSVNYSAMKGEYDYTLMSEYNDGFNWWVIGYLDSNIDFLPRWEYKEKG